MLLRFLLSACISQTSQEEAVSRDISYQKFCMFRTVNFNSRITDLEGLKRKLLPADVSESAVCEWYGIQCSDGLVTRIHWEDDQCFVADSLRWLPPSTRKIKMSYQGVNEDLFTRLLPRSLIVVYLHTCGNFAHIDMETLPPRLEVFAAVNCGVSGRISLNRLPHTMRRIDLRGNLISEIKIDNSRLPPLINEMCFYNPLRPIPVVCAGGGEYDERLRLTSDIRRNL